MKVGARSTTGWKTTISVAMSNYIEAGSIIAIATSLAFWQAEFGISNFAVGLLAALSANAFGAAIGAAWWPNTSRRPVTCHALARQPWRSPPPCDEPLTAGRLV